MTNKAQTTKKSDKGVDPLQSYKTTQHGKPASSKKTSSRPSAFIRLQNMIKFFFNLYFLATIVINLVLLSGLKTKDDLQVTIPLPKHDLLSKVMHVKTSDKNLGINLFGYNMNHPANHPYIIYPEYFNIDVNFFKFELPLLAGPITDNHVKPGLVQIKKYAVFPFKFFGKMIHFQTSNEVDNQQMNEDWFRVLHMDLMERFNGRMNLITIPGYQLALIIVACYFAGRLGWGPF